MKQNQQNILFDFSIDRGGTFTDIYCEIFQILPNNDIMLKDVVVTKLLSENSTHYKDAPTEGIRQIMEKYLMKKIDQKDKIKAKYIRQIRMGTTVATNALLERKGEPTQLLITKGFKDLLQIANQNRSEIFDLTMHRTEIIYKNVTEINERVRIIKLDEKIGDLKGRLVQGINKEYLEVLIELDKQQVKKQLQQVWDSGIRSIAVVLLHSYIFFDHEREIKNIALEIGFTHISLSSEIVPMVKIVPRGQTTTVDAYLNPHIIRYLDSFLLSFDANIKNTEIYFMQSDGGLCEIKSFRGSRSILSGPAGGVVGYSLGSQEVYQELLAFIKRIQQQVQENKINDKEIRGIIGFDMGGTSTDVSRYDGIQFAHIFDAQIAGITIQTPHLDINTVAAGGGSLLQFIHESFKVGPQSAGANPGPVCYGKSGGLLAITDANLILGRIIPEYFPNIFGDNADEPLNLKKTIQEFNSLTEKINNCYTNKGLQPKNIFEVAFGFIAVANEEMCEAIRALTQNKGQDPRFHILSVFGGAAGQHCCNIADKLGISRVFVHQYAGVLSAFGLSMADIVEDATFPANLKLNEENLHFLNQKLNQIIESNTNKLKNIGIKSLSIQTNQLQIKHFCFLRLKYQGTDTALLVLNENTTNENNNYQWMNSNLFLKQFEKQYQQEFGFVIENRKIIIDNIRVRSVYNNKNIELQQEFFDEKQAILNKETKPMNMHKVYFQSGQEQSLIIQEVDCPVFQSSEITPNTYFEGPCIIQSSTGTIVVEHGWRCYTTKQQNHYLLKQSITQFIHIEDDKEYICDPIELSIFGSRFMSIAEQMGKTLQQTSVSTNIKERLDFSCAIFSPKGELVANAPHLPVHLGSMQEAVKFQINYLKEDWKEGEIILSNHPVAGGSHLPDLTIVTPVYMNQSSNPVFYVASRGHHADIGGITPGSMPPNSKFLNEEGVAIKSFKILKNNQFQIQELKELFKSSRNIKDNISDLKAQIAAHNRGIFLLKELIQENGIKKVHSYMKYIQENAEKCVKEMLVSISIANKMKELDFVQETEFMDDGSKICLKLTIDRNKKTAEFNFSGTSYQVYGNTNTPKAVVNSAIIYCLRCLVNSKIPLNQGCLNPISIIVPENSILSPSEEAAVVGGNVLTSQRLTDVILKAFKACAASQGCMNNLTFGNENFGYYETIGGGGGAGPGWNGQHGIHSHMTNTRITDVEIMERRYPVLINQFGLRPNSGGLGQYIGGNGIIRDILFLQPVQVSILSERRVHSPYGMEGGDSGKCGINLWIKDNKIPVNIGGKCTLKVSQGERIVIYTPGGGGYGNYKEKQDFSKQLLLEYHSDQFLLYQGSLQMFLNKQLTN